MHRIILIHYICINKTEQNTHIMKATKKQTVKVLGQTVIVGTKLHAKLIAQVKHFNDLLKHE